MAIVCDSCRLRRRRCDRIRPKCSSCVSSGADCVYEQDSGDSQQPSQLVQELMGIREGLEALTSLLGPKKQHHHHHHPPVVCPPLVLKSPHLMQILGLPLDLASSVLYYRREEKEDQEKDIVVTTSSPFNNPSNILRRFQQDVHRWYPVLQADFTRHFVESTSSGCPYSTKSCLSLLVASLASHGVAYYQAARSMIPIVMQESSVTSVQCLILFSLYFACRLQLRQAYQYIQAAFVKLQPLSKSPYLEEGESHHLLTRLSWTIHLIESELSIQSNLSFPGKPILGPLADISSVEDRNSIWAYDDSEPTDCFAHLSTEGNLQLILNSHTSSAIDASSSSYNHDFLHQEGGTTTPNNPPFDSHSPQQHQQHQQHIDCPICHAKGALYEVFLYWPVIYRVIMDGSTTDPELLPYGPLFFESVISFLCTARIALRICPPKIWFFSASIYIISMVTVRALEVRSLRLLAPPRIWEALDGAVDALCSLGELSESVQYMRDSLQDRLEMARV
ncbi:hypothetical protein FE257_012524 [Aspergillus nanangensis]|uniref:Zn(2)-C6 fungal-type domain-containing protein n=1 Tax=Aspergillus nanangensis TaxID=2582783 RepID=A0AAD4GYY4_ASPNN|nr:hypothetical protein FE257_012524 [Aspergillus nanangensis]